MKNDQFSTASGGEVIHSHLVYFIVPLPEPLGLPDKYLISCGSPTSREQYLKAQMAGRPMPPPWHRAASVVFHRYTSSSSSSQEINHLFELADQEAYSRAILKDSSPRTAEMVANVSRGLR
jgi:hypothetical protein